MGLNVTQRLPRLALPVLPPVPNGHLAKVFGLLNPVFDDRPGLLNPILDERSRPLDPILDDGSSLRTKSSTG